MVSVNKELCIGCGACVSLCPDMFELNSEFKAEAKSREDAGCAQTAVAGCPVQAIELNPVK